MQVGFSKQLKSKDSLISKSQSEHFIEQLAQQKMTTNLKSGLKDEQTKHEAAKNEREYVIYEAVKEAKVTERKYFKLMLEKEKAICRLTTKKMGHAILDRIVSNLCVV